MSEARMGFFEALEQEPREAAECGPRRRAAWSPAGQAAVVAAAATLVLALVPVLALLGGGEEPAPRPAADAPPAAPGPRSVDTVIHRDGEVRKVVAGHGRVGAVGPRGTSRPTRARG